MAQQNFYGGNSNFNERAIFYKGIESSEDIVTTKLTATSVPGIDGISSGILASSKNRIFVSTAGNDTNSGLSADDPVKTIKKAAQIASNNFSETERKSIYISSGEYTEEIPIILPKFCAVIGDSLRTVILRPGVPDVDFFKVREGVMIMNLVFRDNDDGDYTFKYAMAYDDSQGLLVINQSPYALNCSLISTRGRGKNEYSIVAGQWTKGASQTPRGSFAYVDGNAVDSISSGDSIGGNLESMVFALLSIITPGIGIHIDNCAYAQIVNVFGIFNTDNILCENGGYASVTNSATNFGINALRSSGFSAVSKTYSQDVGIVTFASASAVGVGSTNSIIIAGAATSIPASQSIISIVDNGIGDDLNAPSINNLIRIGYDSGETPFTHPSIEFQIRKVSDARTITYSSETRTVYDVAVSPRLDEYFSSPYTNYSSFEDKSIRQLRPSIVNSSSHTWEYAGSGTNYDALPKNGGFTRSLNEQVEEDYGQVYTSGTNELGDFKVGNFVVLKNQTGEVQFTTPIPIATIDRISFSSGNTNLIITGAVNDTQMGGTNPSDNFIPTERAVNVFVSSGTTSISNKTISFGENTITGTTADFNAALTDDDFVTLSGSEVLTNKSISGYANTITDIPNNALTNSTISGVSLGNNLNTLTMGVSGTGLSGSQTYDGSSPKTFTVTSNATSNNTSSTIVSRDSNGDFSAGVVSASGLYLTGSLRDKDNSSGSVGQVLSSTGSDTVQWINASSASVGSATSVSITSESTNATRYINFVSNTSGIDNVRVDSSLTYNPGTDLLKIGTKTFVAFDSGTTMLFYQASAPTGWTKVTTHNDKALRVVSGSGGGSGGSSSFSSVMTSRSVTGSVSGSNTGGSIDNQTAGGSIDNQTAGGSVNAHTLSVTQIPSHAHSITPLYSNDTFHRHSGTPARLPEAPNVFVGDATNASTNNQGSTGSHNHGFTGTPHNHGFTGTPHSHGFNNPSWSGSFAGDSMDFAIQYIDVILCSID